MRVMPALGIWLLLAPPAVGQEVVDAGRGAEQDAAVRIHVLTGSVRISAWNRDSVHVLGRLDPSAGHFFLGGTRTALKLGVELPDGMEPDGTADFEVQIPTGARLWVTSARAEVEVTLAGGTVEVTGVSGGVRIEGQGESATVETIDGNVELALRSRVGRVRTASGTIVVRGIVRDLEASSVSGALLIGMEGAVQRAHLETVASEIAFKGDLEPEGHLEAETHGGDVELRLPARLGAAYHLVSYGGGLINDLVPPSAVRSGPGKGEWTFTTGDGRATVEVRTFKGRVVMKVRGDPSLH